MRGGIKSKASFCFFFLFDRNINVYNIYISRSGQGVQGDYSSWTTDWSINAKDHKQGANNSSWKHNSIFTLLIWFRECSQISRAEWLIMKCWCDHFQTKNFSIIQSQHENSMYWLGFDFEHINRGWYHRNSLQLSMRFM